MAYVSLRALELLAPKAVMRLWMSQTVACYAVRIMYIFSTTTAFQNGAENKMGHLKPTFKV